MGKPGVLQSMGWQRVGHDRVTELNWAFQAVPVVKNLPANSGGLKRCNFDPWVGKIPWKRAWQPTAVFLPGESHGQKTVHGVTKSWA